jgi:hypothetical protein
MTELLDLCYDVLIRILEEINPEDLAACAQTSTAFNEFIKKNTRLYKAHYLKNFVRLRLRCFVAGSARLMDNITGRSASVPGRCRTAMGA